MIPTAGVNVARSSLACSTCTPSPRFPRSVGSRLRQGEGVGTLVGTSTCASHTWKGCNTANTSCTATPLLQIPSNGFSNTGHTCLRDLFPVKKWIYIYKQEMEIKNVVLAPTSHTGRLIFLNMGYKSCESLLLSPPAKQNSRFTYMYVHNGKMWRAKPVNSLSR